MRAHLSDRITKVFEHDDFAIWHVPQANGYVYEAAGIAIDEDNYADCPFERTYDDAGNLKTEKDARGITVTYTWDALNRMTKKQSSDSTTPSCANWVGFGCSLRLQCAFAPTFDLPLRNALLRAPIGFGQKAG